MIKGGHIEVALPDFILDLIDILRCLLAQSVELVESAGLHSELLVFIL